MQLTLASANLGRLGPRYVLALVCFALTALGLAEAGLRVLCATRSIAGGLRGWGTYGNRIAFFGLRNQPEGDRRPDPSRVIHATLGWTNPPGESYMVNVGMHANSQGMRGVREYGSTKPAGVTRIEVFGDSYAFGNEADDDSTFPAQLESRLPGSEVLNFGVPGYGLDQMLLRFREEGRRYHPDVVVVGLTGALRSRDTVSFTFWYKPYFVLLGGRLALQGVPVPGLPEGQWRYTYSSRVYDLLRMLTWRGGLDDELDTKLLIMFVADIKDAGAYPILLLYPSFDEMGKTSSFARIYQGVCSAAHTTCVDTSETFGSELGRGAVLTARVHFNGTGNGIVAEALAKALEPRLR